ncbi:MAG: O-antigen ligase family protein [Bryobacteraceae bacterium]
MKRHLAHMVLVCYAFCCPWFYRIVTIGDNSLCFSDILLPVGLASIVLVARRDPPLVLLPLVGLPMVCLVSILRYAGSPEFGPPALRTVRLAGVICPAVLACLLAPTGSEAKTHLKAFFWGGLVGLWIGIVGFYLAWPPTQAVETFDYGTGAPVPRAGGLFQETTNFGYLAASWCALSVFLLRPLLGGVHRVLLLIAVGVTTVLALYTSMSRSALTNLLAAAIVYVIATGLSGNWRKVVALVAVAALVSLVWFWAGGMPADLTSRYRSGIERFGSVFQIQARSSDLDALSSNRLGHWQTCLALWTQNPFIGIGYRTASAVYGTSPDNMFLSSLVETGVPGFALLVFFYAWVVKRSVATARISARVGSALLAIWVGQIIHGVTGDTWTYFGASSPVLLITLGIMSSIEARRNRSTEAEMVGAEWMAC